MNVLFQIKPDHEVMHKIRVLIDAKLGEDPTGMEVVSMIATVAHVAAWGWMNLDTRTKADGMTLRGEDGFVDFMRLVYRNTKPTEEA